jgi:large conductance mechanosensitive channel
MFKEFKEFAMKGNVLDLAVGVIIGGAFGKIVTSLVNDIVMPLISLFTGNIPFADLFIALDGNEYATAEQAREAGTAVFAYGSFISSVVDFLIIALTIFIVVRQINKLNDRLKPAESPAEPTEKTCPYCLSTINIKAVRCPQCTSDLTKNP